MYELQILCEIALGQYTTYTYFRVSHDPAWAKEINKAVTFLINHGYIQMELGLEKYFKYSLTNKGELFLERAKYALFEL